MSKLRLLLVDDNPNFLKAAREVLAVLPCVARIECASSGPEALALAGLSRPDLVLTDIVMPGMSGFELIRRLRTLENPAHIVALTLHDGAEYRAAVLRCGADELVSKHRFGAQIPDLIASLAGGGDDSVQRGVSPGDRFTTRHRDRRGKIAVAVASAGTMGREPAFRANDNRGGAGVVPATGDDGDIALQS